MIAQVQTRPMTRHLLLALAALGLAAGAFVLFRFNPAQHSFYPTCLFHELTGLECPGCGASRATHQLLHGHVLTALHYNAFFVLALPFLAFAGGRFALGQITGRPLAPIFLPASWIKLLLAAIIVFSVLRNIPFAPFTLLAPPR